MLFTNMPTVHSEFKLRSYASVTLREFVCLLGFYTPGLGERFAAVDGTFSGSQAELYHRRRPQRSALLQRMLRVNRGHGG